MKRTKQHKLQGSDVTVTIKKLKKAKRMTLSVKHDASVVVTLPYWVTYATGKKFADREQSWIQTRVEEILKSLKKKGRVGTRDHYLEHKEQARAFIHEKLEYWNKICNFKYKRVSVRNQSSVWGSCSSNKNLNFNYALFFLPEELADYIVVHELCHLKELNHGPKFWALIEKHMPDYRERVQALNEYKNIAIS